MARQITEQMDGQVSVESQVGKGSVFTVCLPVWRDDNEMANISEVG